MPLATGLHQSTGSLKELAAPSLLQSLYSLCSQINFFIMYHGLHEYVNRQKSLLSQGQTLYVGTVVVTYEDREVLNHFRKLAMMLDE